MKNAACLACRNDSEYPIQVVTLNSRNESLNVRSVRYPLPKKTKEATMSKITSVTNSQNINAETLHDSTKIHGEPMPLEQTAAGAKHKIDSVTPAKKASEKKLDQMADKFAERGKNTEQRYDEDHSIFTK
jgi:hypothetical protein